MWKQVFSLSIKTEILQQIRCWRSKTETGTYPTKLSYVFCQEASSSISLELATKRQVHKIVLLLLSLIFLFLTQQFANNYLLTFSMHTLDFQKGSASPLEIFQESMNEERLKITDLDEVSTGVLVFTTVPPLCCWDSVFRDWFCRRVWKQLSSDQASMRWYTWRKADTHIYCLLS